MRRYRPGDSVKVGSKDGRPQTVEGEPVAYVIDHFRLWPNWWEGSAPRDYYFLQIGEGMKAVEIYRCEGEWFFSRYKA